MDGAVQINGDMCPVALFKLLDTAYFIKVRSFVVRSAQRDEIAADRIFINAEIKIDEGVRRRLKIKFQLRNLHEINMFQRNLRSEIAAGIGVAKRPCIVGEDDFRALIAIP